MVDEMRELSVLVVHGVGTGAGFSQSLKQLVFRDKAVARRRWNECIWKDINTAVDTWVGGMIDEAALEYMKTCCFEGDSRRPRVKAGGQWRLQLGDKVKAGVKAIGIGLMRTVTKNILDLGLDFVLYLDSQHGKKIRDRLRQRIVEVSERCGDDIILVAHSLGSVIAYDVLAEANMKNDPLPVRQLVTLGSPLAWTLELRKVEEKEECKFESIGDIPWTNIYYKEDYVTRHKELPVRVFHNVRNELLPLPRSSSSLKSHSAYWEDDAVAQTIRDILGMRA